MAKKEKANLNKVIVESLTTVVKAANISTSKISFDDLVTLGFINSTGVLRYDDREKEMLTDAARNLFKTKNPEPLFALLRIKNPEYSEEVIGNDFFQEKYREITNQGKTILGYDHRVKALEQRFKPHVSTGKLRVMLDNQEVAPLDYMQLLASAARTERMYTGTAQLREIFKTTQDELITGLFREPDKSKEIQFDQTRQQVLEKLGIDVERLRTTINGGFTETQMPEVADKAKYNMRYFDESLTDEGIERVAHAAKATYTTIATPFFESAMGIRRLDPVVQRSVPIDLRTISRKDADMLAGFMSLKPKETFSEVIARIDSYAEEISTAVDEAVSTIKKPDISPEEAKLGHRLAYQSVKEQLGDAQFADLNYVLKRHLSDRIIETSSIATATRTEFLRSVLRESMNPDFIRENYGEYYLGETIKYRPVLDEEGKPTTLRNDKNEEVIINGMPVTEIEEPTGEYQTMVFSENNVYPITISTVRPTRERLAKTIDDKGNIIEHIVFIPRGEGKTLDSFSEEEVGVITRYINNAIDTNANLRGVTSENIMFGAANPVSKALYDAHTQAQKLEMQGKDKLSDPSYISEKPTKPVLYRDLPLYKQYLAEARQRLDKYVIGLGGPVIEGDPYIQAKVGEQKPPVKETRDDGKEWNAIEDQRIKYSKALSNLQESRAKIDTSNPDYKNTPEFKTYQKSHDQFMAYCAESCSDNATEILQGIFAFKHQEMQPEGVEVGSPEEQPTIYGVMSDMFQNVLDTRKVSAMEKGKYVPAEGEVLPSKEQLFEQRFALVGQLVTLGGAEQAGEILQSAIAPTAPEAAH